jgi:hypothetical protein
MNLPSLDSHVLRSTVFEQPPAHMASQVPAITTITADFTEAFAVRLTDKPCAIIIPPR